MCGRSFLISLDWYLFRTYEFTDTHYDDGQSPRNKTNNFKDTKVTVSEFSADISKSKEISRWRLIDKDLLCDFSATKTFFKNCHNYFSEGLMFFPAMSSTRSKTKLSPCKITKEQTHTQTDCYNPSPILRLIMKSK